MLHPTPDGVVLTVKVIPRAGRSGLADVRGGALRVRLNAAPVDGAANAELIATLAETFGVPKRAVTIVSGERARTKRVRLAGLAEHTARDVIARMTGVPSSA